MSHFMRTDKVLQMFWHITVDMDKFLPEIFAVISADCAQRFVDDSNAKLLCDIKRISPAALRNLLGGQFDVHCISLSFVLLVRFPVFLWCILLFCDYLCHTDLIFQAGTQQLTGFIIQWFTVKHQCAIRIIKTV